MTCPVSRLSKVVASKEIFFQKYKKKYSATDTEIESIQQV